MICVALVAGIADAQDCSPLRRSLDLTPFGRTAPAGARIVPFCDYLELVRSGAGKPLSHQTIAQQKVAALRQDAENEFFIDQYLALHPELSDLREFVSRRPHKTADFQPNRDGTWSSRLPSGDEVTTLGRSVLLSNVADSIRLANDRDRQLAMYRELYDELPAAVFDPTHPGAGTLPTPASLAGGSVADIQSALRNMADLSAIIQAQLPVGPPISFLGCDSEVGTSPLFGDNKYIDREGVNGQPYLVHDGFGIYANFNFPAKPYLTCIRDQSFRGACTAFATVSAAEMMIARATGIHMNLSEQDVWEHYNLALWGGNVVWYGETGIVKTIVAGIISTGYKIPYEKKWDYNPVLSRKILSDPFRAYQDSCISPYPSSEPCSDTTPQAPIVCGLDPQTGNMYCSLQDAGIPGSPHTITAGGDFWMANDRELSTDLIRLHLALNHGVAIGFNTSPKFYGIVFRMASGGGFVDTNYGGYLAFDTNDIKTNSGGHAVHVVGYVSNEDLKLAIPGAPLAPSKGYFIVKNSWSAKWGDGGYGYLPWDYVKSQTYEASFISAAQ